MVGFNPIEAGSLYHPNVLLIQEFEGKLLVVVDSKFCNIQFYEKIKGARLPMFNLVILQLS